MEETEAFKPLLTSLGELQITTTTYRSPRSSALNSFDTAGFICAVGFLNRGLFKYEGETMGFSCCAPCKD